ncbi:MAG: hypothetical protein ACODAD_10230 [Planctomycetota bacterium]
MAGDHEDSRPSRLPPRRAVHPGGLGGSRSSCAERVPLGLTPLEFERAVWFKLAVAGSARGNRSAEGILAAGRFPGTSDRARVTLGWWGRERDWR